MPLRVDHSWKFFEYAFDLTTTTTTKIKSLNQVWCASSHNLMRGKKEISIPYNW